MDYQYAVALTGGIGTGKSTVGSLFKLMGYAIIDADTIAHTVLQQQAERIREMFGEGVMDSAQVDRKALGKIVFAHEAKRQKLESLLHPLIREEIRVQGARLDSKKVPYLVDIPLFFESGHYPITQVIVVYVSRDVQIERVSKRDTISQEEALRRIDSQMDIEEKKARATYVIDNSGTLPQLQAECERVSQQIKEYFKTR